MRTSRRLSCRPPTRRGARRGGLRKHSRTFRGAAFEVGGGGWRSDSERVGQRWVSAPVHDFGQDNCTSPFHASAAPTWCGSNPSRLAVYHRVCRGCDVPWHSGGGAPTPPGQEAAVPSQGLRRRLQWNSRAGAAASKTNASCSNPYARARHRCSGDAPRCFQKPWRQDAPAGAEARGRAGRATQSQGYPWATHTRRPAHGLSAEPTAGGNSPVVIAADHRRYCGAHGCGGTWMSCRIPP